MLDPDLIDDEVVSDIAKNLGVDWDDDSKAAEAVELIEKMSVYQAFDKFLYWNGIIGYTATIIKALDSIRSAEVPNPKSNP